MRTLALCLLAACGTTSAEPFAIDTADCALVNNFTVDGQPSRWTDCRVYWSTAVLTVELTVPATTGSFVTPDPQWLRASVAVPTGEVSATLQSIRHPTGALPTSLPADQLALELLLYCDVGVLGAGFSVETMADVGDGSVYFSMNGITGSCTREGVGGRTFDGGFIVSAAAKAGSTTAADPATVVTVP